MLELIMKHTLKCMYQSHLSVWPTNKLSRFVGPLVDEGLKRLLHGVDESLVPCKAALRHVVHLVLEIQQVLHHVLVFLWSTYDLSTEGLQPEEISTICFSQDLFFMMVMLCVVCLHILYVCWALCVYLYVIPPELQQCGKSSLHLAEELVEEGQLSHTVLIQQGAQTFNKNITHFSIWVIPCHEFRTSPSSCHGFSQNKIV